MLRCPRPETGTRESQLREAFQWPTPAATQTTAQRTQGRRHKVRPYWSFLENPCERESPAVHKNAAAICGSKLNSNCVSNQTSTNWLSNARIPTTDVHTH